MNIKLGWLIDYSGGVQGANCERELSNYHHFMTGPSKRGFRHIQTVAINTLINLHTKISALSCSPCSFTFMPNAKYANFAHGIIHEKSWVSPPNKQTLLLRFQNPLLSWKQWKPQSRAEIHTPLSYTENKLLCDNLFNENLMKFGINSVKMRHESLCFLLSISISKRFEYNCHHLAFCSLFLFRKVSNIIVAILLFALFFYFEKFRISLSPFCFLLSFSISKSFEYNCRHLAFWSLFLFRKVSNITVAILLFALFFYFEMFWISL